MPHASRKQRKAAQSRNRVSGAPPVLSVPFLNVINNTAHWSGIIEALCTYLDLPDLATRSGLKAVHAQFTEYFTRLDTVYIAAQTRGIERLMGGIVGVWAKMCTDAILRDKLFQAGLLTKILPLLDLVSTRHLALQALSTVTHHGGLAARMQIARRNRSLVALMRGYPDDPLVQELAVATLSHSTIAVIGTEQPPEPHLADEIAVRLVLESTMIAIRSPHASRDLIEHALPLLSCATLHFPTDSQLVDGFLPLLVATLRSPNICHRCTALSALIRLTSRQATPGPHFFNPTVLVGALLRPFPDDIATVMLEYGPDRCDSLMTISSTTSFAEAMLRLLKNRNLVTLGRSLADLIVLTEFSITEGGFRTFAEDESRIRGPANVGLPFASWTDALQHCAKAIRALGTDADLDVADTLDMKFFIIRSRLPEAIVMAEGAIARNPDMAYAYYVISLGPDSVKGLRAVKKGLKCAHLTPFIRNYLHWRAVEHAGIIGLEMLQLSQAGDTEYAAGIAFLQSALEDARMFLSEAPPDSRHGQAVLNWYVVLEIAFKGPELSPNLAELKNARERLSMSSRILTFLGYTIERTSIGLARELILDMYHTSTAQWQDFVRRLDEMSTADIAPASSRDAEDNLAAWLDDMESDDGNAHFCARRPANVDNLMLYRCSWCANPSAILKKCGRCGHMRYCDTTCQARHWPQHKPTCRRA